MFDWLIFHYFLQLMSVRLAWKSTAKSNEKLVNNKQHCSYQRCHLAIETKHNLWNNDKFIYLTIHRIETTQIILVIFEGSGFSFENWNTTIIWWFFRVILNFAQDCYYLENKVGVVDFTKASRLGKFQTCRVWGVGLWDKNDDGENRCHI